MRIPVALMLSTLLASTTFAGSAENKRIVTEFYTQAFIKKDLQAARRYLSDDYIQHNPAVKSGADEFMKFASGLHAANPDLKSRIMRVIAEDDLVVLHVYSKPTPISNGVAIVDIFRVLRGKVVEHWDVKQVIPDTLANPYAMF
jgi:predicted SnoaL-like aldol condensation-catalyzing enzyme